MSTHVSAESAELRASAFAQQPCHTLMCHSYLSVALLGSQAALPLLGVLAIPLELIDMGSSFPSMRFFLSMSILHEHLNMLLSQTVKHNNHHHQ